MANPNRTVFVFKHGREASPFTKSALVDMMAEEGWTLTRSEPTNVGEWNERRMWQAVKGDQVVELAPQMKGERTNWKDMNALFHVEALGWTWREWDDMSRHM